MFVNLLINNLNHLVTSISKVTLKCSSDVMDSKENQFHFKIGFVKLLNRRNLMTELRSTVRENTRLHVYVMHS